jgi:hypothetical protein
MPAKLKPHIRLIPKAGALSAEWLLKHNSSLVSIAPIFPQQATIYPIDGSSEDIHYSCDYSEKQVSLIRILIIAPEQIPVPPILGGSVEISILAIAKRLAKYHSVTIVSRAHPRYPRIAGHCVRSGWNQGNCEAHNRNGLLVRRYRAPEAFADAIVRLMQDESLVRKMKRQARADCVARFNWSATAK